MSEQSKAPRWMKVALVIQAIVICLGLGFYRLSIRPIREVQLPTHSEQQAFVKIPDDALSPAVPDVPGQLSVPHASLPSLSSSMPLTLGSDGSVSLGSKDKPLAALSTPGHSDPANLTPSLPNPDPSNPQLQKRNAEQPDSEVTNQQVSDVEISNSSASAVNGTTTRKNLTGSANEIRVFQLQNRTSKEMLLIIRDIFDNSAQFSIDERSNSLIVVASPSIQQKVSDFVTEMESQAEATQAVDMPEISRKSATKSVAQFPSDELDAEFERQARQLALQIRAARPNEKAKLKKELEAITRKQFEHRQDRRREEFDSLGRRVERLKSSYQRRQAHQNEVIQRRINDLLDPNTDLRSDESETPADSLSSRDEAAHAIEAVTQDAKSVNATPTSKSPPIKPERSGPTYNGVTLSEWLSLLEFERNPEKIAEAVVAMLHLKDQADPRQLTRTILSVIRVQGSNQFDNPTSAIMNGSVKLLTLLPSEIVVDEIIADLPVSSSQQPARAFYGYFFNSVGSKEVNNGFLGQKNVKPVDPTILSESLQRLHSEIRRRSRRLINVLVNAAIRDENSFLWAIQNANTIVHISDQRIATYPDLVTIVEKLFEQGVDGGKGSSRISSRAYAAIMLGKSGLQIPEVLAFAAKGFQEEDEVFDSPQFDERIRCLAAIAPFSPDAVNLLGETLATRWKTLLELHDEQIVNMQKREIRRIIETLAEIGNPAVPAIPRLAAIADFRKLINGPVESGMGSMMGMPMGGMAVAPAKTFQELAKSAIKKIEEAKPKPDPQPLPAEDEISMQVPIIGSRKPGVSPVTDQPLRDVVTLVSDPLPAETTYDGVAYSQWLKLLETERKPEKLIAAIEACSLVAAKGDERRIARLIFLAEAIFEAKNWENERNEAWQAGYDALARLPGDAVVDELLHALRDEKSYSTGRGFQIDFLTRNEQIPHAKQIRDKAGEIIAEWLKESSTRGISRETEYGLLAAASSVWRDSGRPMKDFDGLWPQMQKLLTEGYGVTDAITYESQQWTIAATNVVVGAPDTPDLANVLLTHVKKHDPRGAPIIALIGKLGPQAESVVPELVELFLVKLKKLELLSPGMRRTGAGGFFPANANSKVIKEQNVKVAVANEEQQTRVALVRALGEIGIGQKGYYLLSELKLIATSQPQASLPEFLDEILSAADEALQKFGSIKYSRDEKRLLSDRWRLNGRWRLVTKFENSETDERPREISVQIREDQLRWETNFRPKALVDFMNSFVTTGNRINPNMVTVDDTKSPKQIMLSAYVLVPNRGNEVKLRKMAGIYELTDDKLKIQLSQPDQPSPTEFTNEMGQVPEDQMLLEFERIVPEATKSTGGQE